MSTNPYASHKAIRVAVGETAAYGPVGRSPWLDVNWHSHQRWIVIDGQPINTIELGPTRAAGEPNAGQPLVFVHGLAGSWANWLEQLPVFASEQRVLALDLPGFGASPMPTQPVTMSGYARLIDRLLGELGVDGATFVGNSMGGFVAAELAIAFPPRVERLVLISAAGISTTANAGTQRVLPGLRRLERILAPGSAWVAAKSDSVARRARLRQATLNVLVSHPSRIPVALAAELLRGAGKPGFIPAVQAIFDYDVRARLPEIACPTLVVWGARDRVISVKDADAFITLIPNSRKVILEDTGHLAMLERPAAFNALLEDFLAE